MTTRLPGRVFYILKNLETSTSITENQMVRLKLRFEDIAGEIVSINKRLDHVLVTAQQLRDLDNNNSQINRQQQTPALPQGYREVWKRPTENIDNRTGSLRLTMPVFSQLIVDRFFNGDHVTASCPLQNLTELLNEVLANVHTNHHIDIGEVPWGSVSSSVQNTIIQKFEKDSRTLGIRLDECDRSWGAKWMIGYRWGSLHQYKRKRRNLTKKQDASCSDAISDHEEETNNTGTYISSLFKIPH